MTHVATWLLLCLFLSPPFMPTTGEIINQRANVAEVHRIRILRKPKSHLALNEASNYLGRSWSPYGPGPRVPPSPLCIPKDISPPLPVHLPHWDLQLGEEELPRVQTRKALDPQDEGRVAYWGCSAPLPQWNLFIFSTILVFCCYALASTPGRYSNEDLLDLGGSSEELRQPQWEAIASVRLWSPVRLLTQNSGCNKLLIRVQTIPDVQRSKFSKPQTKMCIFKHKFATRRNNVVANNNITIYT